MTSGGREKDDTWKSTLEPCPKHNPCCHAWHLLFGILLSCAHDTYVGGRDYLLCSVRILDGNRSFGVRAWCACNAGAVTLLGCLNLDANTASTKPNGFLAFHHRKR